MGNEYLYNKKHDNLKIHCVSCGGDMYEVYIDTKGNYDHLQCEDCGHLMKIGKNKDDGRLKKPNPTNPLNKEI